MKGSQTANFRHQLLAPFGGSLRSAVIALLSLGFIAISGWWSYASLLQSRPPAQPAPMIEVDALAGLIDHGDDPVEPGDLTGRPLLAFFGYTHCPNVCPMELVTITKALDRLGPRAQSLSALFVTLDPERDTPQVLSSYLEAFHSSLAGLTGSPEAVSQAADAFGVRYARVDFGDGDYAVDHVTRIFVLDGEGRLVAALPFNEGPEALLAVLEPLLAAGGLLGG